MALEGLNDRDEVFGPPSPLPSCHAVPRSRRWYNEVAASAEERASLAQCHVE
jgi:hypothetical protein